MDCGLSVLLGAHQNFMFFISFYLELLCSLELIFVHKDSFALRVCRHISHRMDVHRPLKWGC